MTRPRVLRRAAAVLESGFGDALMLLALVTGVVAMHLAIPGLVPSGGDGGNWLALAAERLGGGVMTADVSYPPLVPTLLGLLERLSGDPIVALVVTAVLSKLSLVMATYVCARPLGRLWAAIAGLLVATGGAMLEAYAWGGYTQLMAMGFGLMATYMIVAFLNTGGIAHLLWGTGLGVATLLTHTMVRALLGVALVVAIPHLFYMGHGRRHALRHRLTAVIAVTSTILLASFFAFVEGAQAGFEPTVNPIGLSRLDALFDSVEEASYPWGVAAIGGLCVLLIRDWPGRIATTVSVGGAWFAASIGLFIATGEPRAVLIAQVGLLILAVVGFRTLSEHLRSGRRRPVKGRHQAEGVDTVRYRAVLVAGVALLSALLVGGLNRYDEATDWYRVVDHAEIAALDELAGVSDRGDLVLAATGHHGNPIGWWVEGYAERPTYTAVDPAFLAFPDEREQAEIVSRFFSSETSEEEALAILEQTGARYLVVDKRASDAPWLSSEFAGAFPILHDTSNIAILEVPRSG